MAINYTKKEVLRFLKSQPVMSIAVNLKGKPHSSILIFDVDENMNFYFATGTQSRKVKALKKNKDISFSVWEYKKILVQGSGKALIVKSKLEIEKAVERLAKVAGEMKDFWPPLIHLWDQDYTVFKIKAEKIEVLSLKSEKIKEGNLSFKEINFK